MDENTPTAPGSPTYWSSYGPGGNFAPSSTLDPFSGRPLLDYKMPGADATTTDMTRTDTTFNPEIAAPQDKSSFENPRLPTWASNAVRTSLGATPTDQLDHSMALSVGGANTAQNLRDIPDFANQQYGEYETQLAGQVASGQISLFSAQLAEARNKNMPAPFVGDAKTTPVPATQSTLNYAKTSGIPSLADLVSSQRTSLGAPTTPAQSSPMAGNSLPLPMGYSPKMFTSDYVVPTWLGGTNTTGNQQVLPNPVFQQKQAVQSVPYTLYSNGLISKSQATSMALTWKDKNANGIPAANSLGEIPVQTAQAIAKSWDDEAKNGPPLTIDSVLQSIPDAADKFGKGVIPEWLRQLLVGTVSGLTANAVPLNSAPGASVVDKIAGLVGQGVGTFIGIDAFGGLTDAAGELLGKTLLSKAVGGLGAKAGIAAARDAAVGSTIGGASILDAAAPAAEAAVTGAKPSLNILNTLKDMNMKQALGQAAHGAASFALYGQAGQTLKDFTQPQQDVLQAHMKELGQDLEMGGLTGFFPGTWKGSSMVGLGTFALGAMNGDSPRVALSNALAMGALHKVGGFAADPAESQKKMAAATDDAATKGALTILHTFAPTELNVPKPDLKAPAPAKDAFTPEKISTWKAAALEAADKTAVDNHMTPEQIATNKQRINTAADYLTTRELPEGEQELAAVHGLTSFARNLAQKTDVDNHTTPNAVLPFIDKMHETNADAIDERPPHTMENGRWTVENGNLTDEQTPENNGVRGDVRLTGQGANSTNEAAMLRFNQALRDGTASPHIILANQAEMAPLLRDASRYITPAMEKDGTHSIDKTPENYVSAWGLIRGTDGKYEVVNLGSSVPSRERIGTPQPDGTVLGNKYAFNNDPDVKSGKWAPENPNFNKDTIAQAMRNRNMPVMAARIAAYSESGLKSAKPYVIAHIGDHEWNMSKDIWGKLGAPEELSTLEENLGIIAADKGKRDVAPKIAKAGRQLADLGENAPKLIARDQPKFTGANEPRQQALFEMADKAHDAVLNSTSPKELKDNFEEELGIQLTPEEAAQIEEIKHSMTGGDLLRTVDTAVSEGRASAQTAASYSTYIKPLLSSETYKGTPSGTLFEKMPLLSSQESSHARASRITRASTDTSGAGLLDQEPILSSKNETKGSPAYETAKDGLEMVGLGSDHDFNTLPLDMYTNDLIKYVHDAPVSDAEKGQLAQEAMTLINKNELDARSVSVGKSDENYQKGVRSIDDIGKYIQSQRNRIGQEFGVEEKAPESKFTEAPSADAKTRVPTAIKEDVAPFFDSINEGKKSAPTTYKRGYDQTFDELAQRTWGKDYQDNYGLMKILTDKDQYGKQVWYGMRTLAGGKTKAPLMSTEDQYTGKQISQPVSVVEAGGRGERNQMGSAIEGRNKENSGLADTELSDRDKGKIAAYESAGHGMGVTEANQNPEENVQDLTHYEAEQRLGLLDEERNGEDPELSPVRGSEDALSNFFGMVRSYNQGVDAGAIKGKKVGLSNVKEVASAVKSHIAQERVQYTRVQEMMQKAHDEIAGLKNTNTHLSSVGGNRAADIVQQGIEHNNKRIDTLEDFLKKLSPETAPVADGQGGPGFTPDPVSPLGTLNAPTPVQTANAQGTAPLNALQAPTNPASLSTPTPDTSPNLKQLDLAPEETTMQDANKALTATPTLPQPTDTPSPSTSPFGNMFNAVEGFAKNAGNYLTGTQTYTKPSTADTNYVVDGIDTKNYATDPNHLSAIKSIIGNLSGINTTQQIDAYIKKVAPKSPVTATMVQNAAAKWGVPAQMILATIQQDSSFGTAGKAVRTNNPGNVGNTDSGAMRAYATVQAGVDAVGQWLAKNQTNRTQPLATVTDENNYQSIPAPVKNLATAVSAYSSKDI